MTIRAVNLSNLKRVKNSVIGNPSAKLALARDQVFVQTLVECLNHPPALPDDPQGSRDDIRIEAAHVISSLSYGSEEALASLLRADAPRAFLYAISNFQPSDPISLRTAFARALRALAVAISETVGPSQWGLRVESSLIRTEAKCALDFLFQIDSLDIYLPLLIDTSPQTSTSIAQLLASAVRNASHRTAIADWLPATDRIKQVKGKRGWEKPTITNSNAPSRQGGWVARHLTALLRSRDSKLQEAALSALAALSKDNDRVATVLAKQPSDRDMPSTLSSILSLSKSRSTDVQLAACLCAAHIIRASTPNHSVPADDSASRTIMNVINRMIASPTDTHQTRTKACYILYYLITDDSTLCHAAYDRGSLEKLANLVKSITPLENHAEWDEDEPESVSCLREASLTAISALALFDNDIRRSITDELHLLPTIHLSTSHRHTGVRYAACQCVRALSRAVSVLRTNIVDSGLGMVVFGIMKKGSEDRRVVGAALAAVCNIVNEFSPLRPIFLDQGLMPRLVQLLHSGDSSLRLSALWAVKNLLRKTSPETKRDVMNHLGWPELADLLADTDYAVQEQAFNILRNLAENEEGIDMIFRELGPEVLLTHLTTGLGLAEPEPVAEDVVLQAAYVLANLSNGSEAHQNLLISHPPILSSLRACLAHTKPEIRRPAVACVLELARTNPRKRKEIVEAGIVSTLKHICEWTGSGVVGVSPGGYQIGHHFHGAGGAGAGSSVVGEDERDVVDQARMALDWLEHGGEAFMAA